MRWVQPEIVDLLEPRALSPAVARAAVAWHYECVYLLRVVHCSGLLASCDVYPGYPLSAATTSYIPPEIVCLPEVRACCDPMDNRAVLLIGPVSVGYERLGLC